MAKINVVWGSPCSGKSTYAKAHMGDSDLVYDYDSLVCAMTGKSGHSAEKTLAHRIVLSCRKAFIRLAGTDDAIQTAWLLTRRPSSYLRDALFGLDTEYIHMDATREECLARLELDESREDKEAWAKIINDYFDGTQEDVQMPGSKYEIYITEEIQPDWEEFNWQTYQYETVESPTSQSTFVKKLGAATSSDEVHLYINSLGGSVKEALGIYSFLRRISASVVAHIDGFAASAASIIAMAADRVIMPANTCMMIHNAAWWAYGNPAQLRKSADDLEVINTAAIESYMMHAGEKLDESTLHRFLDAETWLTAQECLTYGLCDELIAMNGDEGTAMAKFKEASAKCIHVPAAKIPAAVAAKLGAKAPKAAAPVPKLDPETHEPQAGAPEHNNGVVLAMLKTFMED